MRSDLNELARSLTSGGAPFAFCGIALEGPDGPRFHTATARGIVADENSYWRAASISKIVTGRATYDVLNEAGRTGATVESILRSPFRTPTGAAPTVAQLASHQAGLTDEHGYIVPPEMPLSRWLKDAGASIWSGVEPGAQFEYSNLGFVILAACAEAVSGYSFLALADRLLGREDITLGGFNWAGLDGSACHILPTYRRAASGEFVPQIDADIPWHPVQPEPWTPGEYAHHFSPQGGLRISLGNLIEIGQSLHSHPTGGGWIADADRTIGPADLFQSYAWGAQIFDDPSFYPRPLIGHFANAYGFCGGLWLDREMGRVFAYALNGLPGGDEDDGLREQERLIFDAVAQTA